MNLPTEQAEMVDTTEDQGEADDCPYWATYSPEDNKLRLYSRHRLDEDTYRRAKAAGFKWAPKQKLFVAPAWTPGREDLLLELCGDIGDEDTSLLDRAEDRADRFGGYRDRRAQDARAARAAVAAIADHIPLGQPILVGHHSERRARKDAERIRAGMHRAVRMWETSEYWERRAKGAIRHAKYKERPDVRHRRIKGIEADKRKAEQAKVWAEKSISQWGKEGLTRAQALAIANFDYITHRFPIAQYPRPDGSRPYEGDMSLWSALDGGIIDEAQARDIAIPVHQRTIERAGRWIAHCQHRLLYERAMLAEQVGTDSMGRRFDFQVGGRAKVKRFGRPVADWLVILRVNRSGTDVTSITVTAASGSSSRRGWVVEVEEVLDYQPPTAEDVAKVKAVTKKPPICNFPTEGFLEMTQSEWNRRPKDYRVVSTAKATDRHGAYRYRETFRPGGSFKLVQVYITDAKRVDPPPPGGDVERVEFEQPLAELPPVQEPPVPAPQRRESTELAELRKALKAGIQVVSAPQLFPTPEVIIDRMMEAAEIRSGHRVLEPSAGTGMLAEAVRAAGGAVTLVEFNQQLAAGLRARFEDVRCADFLAVRPVDLEPFDRVVMNPPFERGADIKHIMHARQFLRPGGRLVALCAAGPRQHDQLQPLALSWEVLPAGSFREQGTDVRVAMLVIEG